VNLSEVLVRRAATLKTLCIMVEVTAAGAA
jgi:hypothetical protein